MAYAKTSTVDVVLLTKQLDWLDGHSEQLRESNQELYDGLTELLYAIENALSMGDSFTVSPSYLG